MEHLVIKHIEAQGVDMELVVSASGPEEVLEYLKEHPDKHGLYFLDVDLQHELNGIELGSIIRETDPLAKIVFITTHAELAHLTFENKVGAMDYILKDRPTDADVRTIESILAAYSRYLEEQAHEPHFFNVNANGEIWRIPHNDILFFESHPKIEKRVILHMVSGELDFRGKLHEVAEHVPKFYSCHRSFLVNLDNITHINKTTKEAFFSNGESVLIAARKMSAFVRLLEEQDR